MVSLSSAKLWSLLTAERASNFAKVLKKSLKVVNFIAELRSGFVHVFVKPTNAVFLQ